LLLTPFSVSKEAPTLTISRSSRRLVESWLIHTSMKVLPPNAGFILDKKIGVNQPKRVENAQILIANTRTFV
jgi:hypothetical protein